jgi:hypothetical protein
LNNLLDWACDVHAMKDKTINKAVFLLILLALLVLSNVRHCGGIPA